MQPIPFAGVEPCGKPGAAIIPVPLEATVSYGEGTAQGPLAIILASQNMELYDELLDCEPTALGIATRQPLSARGSVKEVLMRLEEAVAKELSEGIMPVVLGGEHTVSLGALQAVVKAAGEIDVVCVDAHLDLRESYEGRRLSHACVMRRVVEMGLKVVHVGVRSASSAEVKALGELGLNPLWAHEIHRDSTWVDKLLERLGPRVYLSLDVDGLDTSIMPATGTPEPGGLTWAQVSELLIALGRHKQVVAMDMVEFAPIPGQHAWDFTAARLLQRAIGAALKERSR